jgi:hypothetical protein
VYGIARMMIAIQNVEMAVYTMADECTKLQGWQLQYTME